jgi:NAD(P)-dependent dehydrogenase (short-subunit alcohol dehydrogenase family)
LDERVAIVTGAGSGIGQSTARHLAQRGLDVALVGRRRERLDDVAAGIAEAGGRSFPVPADLARREAPWNVVERVLAERGRVDVIVNNAASFGLKSVDEFTLEEFDDHIAVNVRAAYFLVQAALPALRSSPAAVVVNVSSAAAAMYRRGQTVYGLTKAALEHMTMNMAAELAPDRETARAREARPAGARRTARRDRPLDRASRRPRGRLGHGHGAHDRRRSDSRPARSLSPGRRAEGQVPGRRTIARGKRSTRKGSKTSGRDPVTIISAIASPAGGETVMPSIE